MTQDPPHEHAECAGVLNLHVDGANQHGAREKLREDGADDQHEQRGQHGARIETSTGIRRMAASSAVSPVSRPSSRIVHCARRATSADRFASETSRQTRPSPARCVAVELEPAQRPEYEHPNQGAEEQREEQNHQEGEHARQERRDASRCAARPPSDSFNLLPH
jgi:hypothetical protein